MMPLLLACLWVMAPSSPVPASFPFDGTLASTVGHAPVLAEGVLFTEGRQGEAAYVGGRAHLAYPVGGLYDPAKGTIGLWVRPRWNARDIRGDRLLWSVAGDAGADNQIALGFYGGGDRTIVYFSNPAGADGVVWPIGWQAGEWHHLLACWDESTRCRALYIDGVRVGVSNFRRDMPRTATTFQVGYLPGEYQGATDACQAECDIDDLRLAQTVEPADFAEAVAGLEESATRAEREALRARLAETFSLDRVAREHIEVTWDDVLGLCHPMTKRVPIQVRHHPDVVFVQPDMSISLGTRDDALGLGLALGIPPRLPGLRQVVLRLHRGYQPIVISQWETDGLTVTQTALCTLVGAEDVRTGRETQYVITHTTVSNTGDTTRETTLTALIGRMGGSQNTNYGPFMAPVDRWLQPDMGLRLADGVVTVGDRGLLAYRAEGTSGPELRPTLALPVPTGAPQRELTNCLCFPTSLAPGEETTVDLVAPTAPGLCDPQDLAQAALTPFAEALSRAEAYWDAPLAKGMKLTTPEPRYNDIYRHLILSSLQSTVQEPDRPWHVPYQSVFAPSMVWPWEFAHMAVPLMSIGYAEEMRPSLAFFTERQTGVGPHSAGRGPEGDVLSVDGCYTGTSMYWMCETGSVLWALGEEYLRSGDADWLRQQRPSILAAWGWIQRERARTRLRYDDGRKVEYYGLLPKGRVHDWEGHRYHFGFSDGYTWKGMSTIANAFARAGLPEADRLTAEAEEYKQCILDVARRAEFTDPETGLSFVPSTVFHREGARGGVWWADGPQALFASGILDPTDRRFEPMLEYLDRKWTTLMGLMGHMDGPPDNTYWYVNSTEREYYRDFLARGEFEKAWLVFTSNLAYTLSHDCYQTVERIDLYESNFAPFQPNPSGNGRLLDMFKRMVVDEQDPRTLWLLRGCPRAWLAPGQSVRASDAPTAFGTVGVESRSTEGAVVVQIDPPAQWPPDGLRVVVRRPGGGRWSRITVNGHRAELEDGIETVRVRKACRHLTLVCQP
ncbi:MAG TPA: hypothetical protein PLD23_00060 [Armatimonadota bacterium]|nr:hypothetical protein [Armatimonadota bacterium]